MNFFADSCNSGVQSWIISGVAGIRVYFYPRNGVDNIIVCVSGDMVWCPVGEIHLGIREFIRLLLILEEENKEMSKCIRKVASLFVQHLN